MLHDKFMVYVIDCFMSHTIFHKVCLIVLGEIYQWTVLFGFIVLDSDFFSIFIFWCCAQALKEAFEVFLNKGVAGSSSAELLATFCDNILKKGGSEKLSDEAIEDSLEKVTVQTG